MEWVKAVQQLRAGRQAGVLVTVMSVRGHAPREAGAKMVVAADNVWSTVGGGNLEALAVERSREMIADDVTTPEVLTAALSDKAPYQHGVQCCGGEVKLLLEPLPVVPSVAIFGVGHVGLELARVLARHDLELHLIDSRTDQLTADRLAVLEDAVAHVHVHNVPVLPELVVGELPPGTHVLIMTHDHAEDAALCDAAIRNEELATIGLIGSQREVDPVPAQARRGRQLRRGDRADHHADRSVRSSRQGAGRDRGERRSLAPAAVRRRAGLRLLSAGDSAPAKLAERHPASAHSAVRRPTPAQREAKA